MKGYRLKPSALTDLAEIHQFYADKAGGRVARQMVAEFKRTFRLLARTPGIGHKRSEWADDRPLLFWPMRDFLIIYRSGIGLVEILSVVRGSRDVPDILTRRQLA